MKYIWNSTVYLFSNNMFVEQIGFSSFVFWFAFQTKGLKSLCTLQASSILGTHILLFL